MDSNWQSAGMMVAVAATFLLSLRIRERQMRRRGAEHLAVEWEQRQALTRKLANAERDAEIMRDHCLRLEGMVDSLRLRLSAVVATRTLSVPRAPVS